MQILSNFWHPSAKQDLRRKLLIFFANKDKTQLCKPLPVYPFSYRTIKLFPAGKYMPHPPI